MNLLLRVLRNPRYYAERIGFRIYKRELLFYKIVLANVIASRNPTTVKYIVLGKDFIENHEAIGWLSKEESLEQIKRSGFVVCGAMIADKLVGNCWLELETVDLTYFDITTCISSDQAYISRVFVTREARGNHVSEGLIAFALKEAHRRGKISACICCVPANSAMRHILRKLGWTFDCRLLYVRFLSLRLYRSIFEHGNNKGRTFGAKEVEKFLFHASRGRV
jgi:GNAT superfamily N-acetyltransferase